MLRPPPTSTLFPYTTLFRSRHGAARRPRCRLAAAALRANPARAGHLPAAPGVSLAVRGPVVRPGASRDRKSTRLNSSHVEISYAVFCLKKKKKSKDHRDCDV